MPKVSRKASLSSIKNAFKKRECTEKKEDDVERLSPRSSPIASLLGELLDD
jgi:hypothetical protein